MNSENQNQRSSSADGSGNREGNEQFKNSKYRHSPDDEDMNNDEFPGYPHYPASEDIMNPANQVERVPVDVENLAPSGALPKKPEAGANTSNTKSVSSSTDDEISIVPGTEADVTKEELHLLNATEGSYAEVSNATTVTGEDLDVPGADQDDPNEDIGEEDEENNYYSLGGDNHENLEEDPS